MRDKRSIGIFQVVTAGCGFGFLGVFARLIMATGLNVGELLFWRFFFAAIGLWAGLLITKPKLVQLGKKQIFISCLLGIFGYAIFSSFYFLAIRGMPVALAAMILFTFPLFVSIGGHVFLKEKLSKRQWLTLVTGLVGLAVLLDVNVGGESIKSMLYALTAALTYSVYVLVSGRVQKDVQPLSSSLYLISATAVAFFVFYRPDLLRPNWGVPQIFLLLGIAGFSTIMPLTMFLAGLQKMSSSQASILVMVEPVVAAVMGWWILSESLSFKQLAGAAIVIASIILHVKKAEGAVQTTSAGNIAPST